MNIFENCKNKEEVLKTIVSEEKKREISPDTYLEAIEKLIELGASKESFDFYVSYKQQEQVRRFENSIRSMESIGEIIFKSGTNMNTAAESFQDSSLRIANLNNQ